MKSLKEIIIAGCEVVRQSPCKRTVYTIILGSLLVFTAGCNSMSNASSRRSGPNKTIATAVAVSPEPTTKHCDLKSFDSVVVGGNAKVEFVKGSCAVDITGMRVGDYNSNDIEVLGHTLYVRGNKSIDSVKIMGPSLKNILVVDNAHFCAKKLSGENLVITAKDNAEINLEGRFGVDKIFQNSNGRMNIGWIDDSDKLFVSGRGNGPIYLSGSVNNLVIRLFNDSHLSTRYLRAKEVAVFTVDSSHAEVLALDSLDAFAVDRSSIYYYKKPEHLTVVTRSSGSVIQPGWIE